jgi:hypothetical protein
VDELRRGLERAWESDPADREALQRLVEVRRRSGLPLSSAMFRALTYPARQLESALPLLIEVELPDGELVDLGCIPWGGAGLDVPEHRTLWATPLERRADDLLRLACELRDLGVHGVRFKEFSRGDQLLASLAGLPLTHLDLRDCLNLTDEGLSRLHGLPRLAFLWLGITNDIDYSSDLTDAGLPHVATLPHLVHLELSGEWDRFTDAGLSSIRALSSLDSLVLSGDFTAEGLANLSNLDALSVLTVPLDRGAASVAQLPRGLRVLHACVGTGSAIEGIESLQSLERLAITQTSDDALSCEGLGKLRRLVDLKVEALQFGAVRDVGAIGALAGLRSLALVGLRELTDDAVGGLRNLSELEEVELGGCAGLTDTGLAALQGTRHLVELGLSGCTRIQGRAFAKMDLRGLRRLDVSGCGSLVPEALESLRSSALEELELSCCAALTNAALSSIGSLQNLQSLALSSCSWLDDAGLAALEQLPRLTRLSANNDPRSSNLVTDAGLATLAGLTTLKVLEMANSTVTSAGLAHLSELIGLERLTLTGCGRLTGEGLAHLRGLERLRNLDLSFCESIDDSVWQSLAALPRLEFLGLAGTRVTDAGIPFLERLTKLRVLRVQFSGMTRQGARTLRGVATGRLQVGMP